MAFIQTNEVQEIRKELKATFPNLRFSVKKHHNSEVTVAIMKGDIDFTDVFADHSVTTGVRIQQHAQINHYWIDENHTPEHAEIFHKIVEIIKTAPAKADGGEEWFDKSDSQSDYFHTAFYFNVHVGQWDKPYEYKEGLK